MSNAFEDSSRDLCAPGPSRQSQKRSSCTKVPDRRTKSDKCRNERDAATVETTRCQRITLFGMRKESEIITKPLHARAGGKCDGFEAPGLSSFKLGSDDRERSIGSSD